MKGFHICFVLLFLCILSQAQNNNVGIGTSNPAPSAKLDVSSTSQGFLPPRMTYAQRNTITTPVPGLMIWCTNCSTGGEMQIYTGNGWMKFGLSAASVPMEIGAPFGGGIIAYILQPGDPGYSASQTHGLIAAPNDQSMNAAWGCYSDALGAFGTSLGTGAENTEAIVGECPDLGIAARLSSNLVLGGFSDWYLPSKDELNKLYLNRDAIGGFSQNLYWSSSEINAFDVWAQSFYTGDAGLQQDLPKIFDVAVRSVRSF